MTYSAETQVLYERHLLFVQRRRRLCNASGPLLDARLSWPAFWQQIDATLRRCGYRHSTRRHYRNVLRGLRHHGLKRPADVDTRRIRDYIFSLGDRRVSWSWIALHIGALRVIFDHLCGLNVTAGLVTPKRGMKLPEILNRAEAEALVAAGGNLHNQLLLGLLYGCGLSGSEAAGLYWSDVLSDGRRLHIAASWRYMERTVAVPEALQTILRTGAETCDPQAPVFPGRSATGTISLRAIQAIVARARKRADIGRPVSALTLRHSYAVHRLEAGAALRRVQRELGHASIRTTERYRRCIAPRIDVHPLTQVRALMAQQEGKPIPPPAVNPYAETPYSPLERSGTIDVSPLHLPFPMPGRSAAAAFLKLLTNRLLPGFLRRPSPG